MKNIRQISNEQPDYGDVSMTMMNVMTPATHEVVTVEVANEFQLDLITPNGGLIKEAGSLVVAAADVTPKSLDALFGDYEVDKTQTEAFRAREARAAHAGEAILNYL